MPPSVYARNIHVFQSIDIDQQIARQISDQYHKVHKEQASHDVTPLNIFATLCHNIGVPRVSAR